MYAADNTSLLVNGEAKETVEGFRVVEGSLRERHAGVNDRK